jgi:hypothetical protein
MVVKFMWDLLDEPAMVQVFLQYFGIPPPVITPPKLHNRFYFKHSLARRTSGRSVGAFTHTVTLFWINRNGRGGEISQKVTFTSFLSPIRRLTL